MDSIIIENFYNGNFERRISKQMLYYAFEFPKDEVDEYISNINNVSYDQIVDYVITDHAVDQLEAKDVFQFSSFDMATKGICQKLNSAGDPGMKFREIGKLLLDDGVERKDGAYIKYGENHVKTSTMFGLTYELTGSYFLSCIGKRYIDIDIQEQDKLLTRLILRTKLISTLIQNSEKDSVEVRALLPMLSDATYVRRRSNIKRVLQFLDLQGDAHISENISRIIL